MRRLPAPMINKIALLRTDGVSFKGIAQKLGISKGSAHNYARETKLPEQAKQALLFNEAENRRKFADFYAKEKEITFPCWNSDFAFVLGHLFFDGCVHISRGRYLIGYANASYELIQLFNVTVEKLFSITPAKVQKFKGKPLGWFQTAFYSKKLAEWLFQISPTFSTSFEIGVPEKIRGGGKAIICSFLQAFWDDEGCIDYKGRLIGASKSLKMIDDLVELHQGVGIECKRYLSNRNKVHSIIIKKRLENYNKFYAAVGFGKSVVTAGYNAGRYKQDVLIERLQKMASF